ncbi:hypothetical protein HPB50_022056 [Hyalomma asiaticum]|uniref:Uncharacterized protein n=1 Tax=Hyalomma asiaticum TaxID=266040 RepID=A0ACB7SAY4_HYAAI|nr:hypothetical protein HPB50_022056 [Hyalomma asiaticum]
MRLTAFLRVQNEVYYRKKLWKGRRTLRKVQKFRTPQPLLDKGVEIHDALEVAANEFVPEPFEPPEPHGIPDEKRQDSRNPNWHDHKAYIVHKKSRLLEGDKHMCLLTKTVRYDGLPTALSEHVRQHALGEALQTAAKEALAQVHLYDCTQVKLPKKIDLAEPHWNFPREFGVPVSRKVPHLLASYHHLCEKLTSHVPGVMDRTRLSDVVSNVCFQKADGNTMVFSSGVDTLTTSKVPLEAFNTPEEVKATADVVMPDLYPAKYTLDLDKGHVYRMDDIYHALTLPEPVALQCTYSDVETFGFLAYQLNTLDLSTDEGIKNQVWVAGEPHKLFESCTHKEGIVGHNPAVFQHFLAFYTSGLSQLPSLEG